MMPIALKILPRLLLAAVLLTISWPLMAYIVGFFNDLGNWIGDIILYPFQGLYPQASHLTPVGIAASIAGDTTVGIAAIVAALTASAALDIIGVITLLLSLLLALIVAFVTLMIREMIIILCVITAPVAIVMYILPTTQRFWKFWRDALISALLMFPIIAAFLAAGRVLAILFAVQGGATVLLAPIAIIVSYFMLGTAFRLAGGLAAQAHGMVSGFHSGAFKGLSNYRRKKMQSQFHDAQHNRLIKRSNPTARWINDRASNLTNIHKRGWTPNRRTRQSRARANKTEIARDVAREQIAKDPAFIDISASDNDLRAAEETGGAMAARLWGTGRRGVESSYLNSTFRGNVARRLGVNGNTLSLDDIRNNLTPDEQLQLGDKTEHIMGLKNKYGNDQALRIAAMTSDMGTNTRWRDTEGLIDPRTGRVAHDSSAKTLRDMLDTSRDENGVVDWTTYENLTGTLKSRMGARKGTSGASFGDQIRIAHEIVEGVYNTPTGDIDITNAMTRSAHEGTNAFERAQGQKPYETDLFADYEVDTAENLARNVEQAERNLRAAEAQVNARQPIRPTPPPPPPPRGVNPVQWRREWPARWRRMEIQRQRATLAPQEEQVALANRALDQHLGAVDMALTAQQGASTDSARRHANRTQNVEFQDPLTKQRTSLMRATRVRRDGYSDWVRLPMIDNSTGLPITDPRLVTRTNPRGYRYGPPQLQPLIPESDDFHAVGKQYSTAQAARNSAGQLPTGGPWFSDFRLKRNIMYLTSTDRGINLYRFKYIWSDTEYVGVIAQELVDNHAGSVLLEESGYYAVDYQSLGLKITKYKNWKGPEDSLYSGGQLDKTVDMIYK